MCARLYLVAFVATTNAGSSYPPAAVVQQPDWVIPLAGLLSGISQVLAEQPLDTLKTRLQSTQFGETMTPLELARATARLEGAGAFMRGVMPRLLTYPLVKLSLFTLYEHLHARTGSTIMAGACAGILNTAIACPVDLIKSVLQVARSPGAALTASELLRAQGWRALYRGIVPLMVRDGVGYAILYSVYNQGKRADSLQALPGWVLGGLAGASFYAATLPVDRVKVMMQTQPAGMPQSLRGAVTTLQLQGVRSFYRGAAPTLVRTFLGQAVALSTYDLVVSRGSQLAIRGR